jgi:hypothetical protein
MSLINYENETRISRASISCDNDFYPIGNLLLPEIQGKLRRIAKGDTFMIDGLGRLEVHAVSTFIDYEARNRFKGSFNFLKYVIYCRRYGFNQ